MTRKVVELPPEALLDPPGQRYRGGQREAAGQLSGRQPTRQLQQGQGIALGLGHDEIPDPGVQRPGKRGVEQGPRVLLRQPLHNEFVQPGQLIAWLPGREHQARRIGGEQAGHESQGKRGGMIQPLLVIDHTDQRLLRGYLRQEAEDRQPEQEPIRRRPGTEAECDPQRFLLRHRQPSGQAQHWRAHS